MGPASQYNTVPVGTKPWLKLEFSEFAVLKSGQPLENLKNNPKNFQINTNVLPNRKKLIEIDSKYFETEKISNEDLDITKGILCKNTKMGIGIDFHSLVDGECLVVGGHKIKCEFASDAHSDGDVLTHAVTDALLGALNLGDIGEHFPNNPEYLNIPSTELLKKILKKMCQQHQNFVSP